MHKPNCSKVGDRGVIGDRGPVGSRGPTIPPHEWAQVMAEVETMRPKVTHTRPWVSYKTLFAIAAVFAALSLISHYL